MRIKVDSVGLSAPSESNLKNAFTFSGKILLDSLELQKEEFGSNEKIYIARVLLLNAHLTTKEGLSEIKKALSSCGHSFKIISYKDGMGDWNDVNQSLSFMESSFENSSNSFFANEAPGGMSSEKWRKLNNLPSSEVRKPSDPQDWLDSLKGRSSISTSPFSSYGSTRGQQFGSQQFDPFSKNDPWNKSGNRW